MLDECGLYGRWPPESGRLRLDCETESPSMTNAARQARHRAKRAEQIARMAGALRIVADELAESQTEKGKRLRDIALAALQ